MSAQGDPQEQRRSPDEDQHRVRYSLATLDNATDRILATGRLPHLLLLAAAALHCDNLDGGGVDAYRGGLTTAGGGAQPTSQVHHPTS